MRQRGRKRRAAQGGHPSRRSEPELAGRDSPRQRRSGDEGGRVALLNLVWHGPAARRCLRTPLVPCAPIHDRMRTTPVQDQQTRGPVSTDEFFLFLVGPVCRSNVEPCHQGPAFKTPRPPSQPQDQTRAARTMMSPRPARLSSQPQCQAPELQGLLAGFARVLGWATGIKPLRNRRIPHRAAWMKERPCCCTT